MRTRARGAMQASRWQSADRLWRKVAPQAYRASPHATRANNERHRRCRASFRRLSKTLRARHLAMISIGGIIGAGVFVGSSTAISTIGPAVVLSYIFAGIVVFAVIKILARMALDQPGLGAFTEYVRVALGPTAGFISGWMYWYFWVIVVGIEAIAGANIVHGWLPNVRGLADRPRAHGRAHARQSLFGAFLRRVRVLVRVHQGRRDHRLHRRAGCRGCSVSAATRVRASSNLTAQGGFAPSGYAAVFTGVTTVIFSMCGAEIITVAAAESAESEDHVAARRQRGGAHPAVLRGRDLPHRVRAAVERVRVRRFHVLQGARTHRHSRRAR